jgi:hypothetical protein
MAHRFDVVPVRIVDERSVVARVILRPNPRGAVVAPAGGKSRLVECVDGSAEIQKSGLPSAPSPAVEPPNSMMTW